MSEETTAALAKAAEIVSKSKDIQKFLDFLEAFKLDQSSHIQGCFKEDSWNIRTAALCAEAYAAADLMIRTISPVNDEKRAT